MFASQIDGLYFIMLLMNIIVFTENPSHLLVARAHDVVTWDYEQAKVVCTEPMDTKLNTTLISAVIPCDYQKTKEIFAIDNLFRFVKVNVASGEIVMINRVYILAMIIIYSHILCYLLVNLY